MESTVTMTTKEYDELVKYKNEIMEGICFIKEEYNGSKENIYVWYSTKEKTLKMLDHKYKKSEERRDLAVALCGKTFDEVAELKKKLKELQTPTTKKPKKNKGEGIITPKIRSFWSNRWFDILIGAIVITAFLVGVVSLFQNKTAPRSIIIEIENDDSTKVYYPEDFNVLKQKSDN